MIDPDLLARLRQLCDHALNDGAAPEWVNATADAIVQVLLRQRGSPRQRTLALAATLANAVKTMERADFTHGAAVGVLRQRTGLSRSRLYALLDLDLSCNNAGHIKR